MPRESGSVYYRHQDVFETTTRHILDRKMGSQGKKKAAVPVKPLLIRTLCLLNFFQMWASTFVYGIHIVYKMCTHSQP